MTVTFGSLFSGIGGFDLAFERAGMQCLWQSEIDSSASTVLGAHWPDVPNHGDITAMRGDDIPPVHVICGGFPCQDLSVAGKRAGLDGARSGLFFEFMRIVEEMRGATGGLYPELVVIENVPGLFSSNKGSDFGVLLDTLAELGAVDIGWRVLDAQWFGVAQRRRRVFVVVDFGGRRAAEILALADSLSGDSPPSREAGESVAGTLGGGTGLRGWSSDTDRMTFVAESVASTLSASYRKGPGYNGQDDNIIALGFDWFASASQSLNPAEIAPTLKTAGHPAVAVPIQNATRGKDQNGIGVGHPCDPMYTLDNASQHAVAFSAKDHGADSGDIAPTLRAMAHDQSHANGGGQVAVAYQCQGSNVGEMGTLRSGNGAVTGGVPFVLRGRESGSVPEPSGDISPAIRTPAGGSSHTFVAVDMQQVTSPQNRQRLVTDGPVPTLHQAGGAHVIGNMSVRRLTPRECERLQGFPDDWTLVDDMADSPRYRMLGNAVAVPVAEWIGQRIVSVL